MLLGARKRIGIERGDFDFILSIAICLFFFSICFFLDFFIYICNRNKN